LIIALGHIIPINQNSPMSLFYTDTHISFWWGFCFRDWLRCRLTSNVVCGSNTTHLRQFWESAEWSWRQSSFTEWWSSRTTNIQPPLDLWTELVDVLFLMVTSEISGVRDEHGVSTQERNDTPTKEYSRSTHRPENYLLVKCLVDDRDPEIQNQLFLISISTGRAGWPESYTIILQPHLARRSSHIVRWRNTFVRRRATPSMSLQSEMPNHITSPQQFRWRYPASSWRITILFSSTTLARPHIPATTVYKQRSQKSTWAQCSRSILTRLRT
jgi:hypothetical protein